MRFKDIIDKKIAINCRTEEEVKKLFEYAKENGLSDCQGCPEKLYWWRFDKRACYRFYLINDNKEFDWIWSYKNDYEKMGYKIITLDDLEDFKKEVFIIKFQKFIDEALKNPFKFSFNKTKKKLYLKYVGKEIRVKCDEKDKFDWKIGLGLALYRVYQKNNDVKYMKKNYNYKKLAEYCLYKFYDFDENKIKDLEDRVNNSKENTLIRL